MEPLKKFSQDLYSEKHFREYWLALKMRGASICSATLCASVFCELETITKHTQIPCTGELSVPRPQSSGDLPSPAFSLGGRGGWVDLLGLLTPSECAGGSSVDSVTMGEQ